MIDTQKQAAFRLMLLDAYGLPDGYFRPADVEQPTEGQDFCAVQFNAFDSISHNTIDNFDNTHKTDENNVLFDVVFEFIGAGAGLNASRLELVLERDDITAQLYDMGFGLIECSKVSNLSALELNRTERFRLTVTMNYVDTVTYNETAIISASVNIADVDSGAVNVVVSDNGNDDQDVEVKIYGESDVFRQYELWRAIAGNEQKTFAEFLQSSVSAARIVSTDTGNVIREGLDKCAYLGASDIEQVLDESIPDLLAYYTLAKI